MTDTPQTPEPPDPLERLSAGWRRDAERGQLKIAGREIVRDVRAAQLLACADELDRARQATEQRHREEIDALVGCPHHGDCACAVLSRHGAFEAMCKARDEVSTLTAHVARLCRALGELHTMVQGECPSLLNDDSGGDARLALEIERLLGDPHPLDTEEGEGVKPSIGRIVHVALAGRCYAAIVTEVGEHNAIRAVMFQSDSFYPTRAVGLLAYAEDHRDMTWHWPERVE